MVSRPSSPLKQTFKRLLSPSKSKPAPPPALSLQGPDQTNNWKYAESTSSSDYSSSNDGYTGWNVAERPQTPISGPNKENVQITPKDVVEQVMGYSPPKLKKRNTKSTGGLKNKPQDADLDLQFEELMVLLSLMLLIVEFPINS
jgi:hypothetical protein